MMTQTRPRPMLHARLLAFCAAAALCGPLAAAAQPKPATPAQPQARAVNAAPLADNKPGAGFGELGSNKQPINIDSDRLDVFDKEGRAVFNGNVVAVQGDSTMKCNSLNVFYEQRAKDGAAGRSGGGLVGGGGMSDNSSIKKIECRGPVTIVSKTQVATGDNADFDRVANKVFLTGNAALSDGQNVTRGERIVYDLNTGRANVEAKQNGRVRALFVPGGGDKDKPAADKKPPR
jgi:lipopolysaccharide export system protein LptA